MDLSVREHLHRRVARTIAGEIARGALRPGDRLPSERTLCERFAVSRVTVRRALAELAADGMVEAQAGRGSFVASAPLGEAPNTLMSFTELGAARGLEATARVLAAQTEPADLDEADAFGIVPGAPVFMLERLRLMDGMPVAVDRSRVPLGRAPALGATDFTRASLYAVLERAGAGPVRADYAVQAVAADDRQAELLDVDPGFPLLQTTTTGYDAAGRIVEKGAMAYRGDRYRFRATLTRAR